MSSNNTKLIFVYGSLRSGFKHPAYEYISRYFTLLGNAKVKGILYDLGDYPAAKPTEEEKYIVGEIYQIKNEDEFNWAIGQLDDYEGITVEEDETPLYCRETATVFWNDNAVTAWMYWYKGDTNKKPIIESGDVLEYLLRKK